MLQTMIGMTKIKRGKQGKARGEKWKEERSGWEKGRIDWMIKKGKTKRSYCEEVRKSKRGRE